MNSTQNACTFVSPMTRHLEVQRTAQILTLFRIFDGVCAIVQIMLSLVRVNDNSSFVKELCTWFIVCSICFTVCDYSITFSV